MTSQIVLGLGYGDEGKGMITDYLCSNADNPLVIRFSGGHQAGHTVVYNGMRHIFSSFGSGTLRGAATYWSQYCTFAPAEMMTEHEHLLSLGVTPTLYVDALAPVTTFYDVAYNRLLERSRGEGRHGSVGTGFGCTVERHQTPCKLHAMDIEHPAVLRQKLDAIKKYYSDRALSDGLLFSDNWDDYREAFLRYVDRSRSVVTIVVEEEFLRTRAESATFVFEGSQGILLDMDYGFFPHVTRANTTGRNAIAMILRAGLSLPEVVYVTRCYQTRHGAGWMSNEEKLPSLIDNPNETNVHNEWQGSLRRGLLDLDLINYALQCDRNHTFGCTRSLAITCLDQIGENIPYTVNTEQRILDRAGTTDQVRIMEMVNPLDIDEPRRVLLGYSEDSAGICDARAEPEIRQH